MAVGDCSRDHAEAGADTAGRRSSAYTGSQLTGTIVSTAPFMTAQRVLVMLFAYTTGLSFALTSLASRGLTETEPMRVASSLVVSLLIFMWYWFDSRARLFRRTPWLNIGVIAVAFIAIPYYLFRSRPPGQRARAFGNLCGVLALLIVSMIVGGLPAALL